MAKPTKHMMVSCRIPRAEMDHIEEVLARSDQSLSEYMRQAVRKRIAGGAGGQFCSTAISGLRQSTINYTSDAPETWTSGSVAQITLEQTTNLAYRLLDAPAQGGN